jgi:uncharacterized protein (DUF1778 family)
MSQVQLPSAGDFAKKIALAEAEEAASEARAQRQAEQQKKEFLEQLQRPSGISDDEAIARALKLIEGAVQSRRTEVQVYRFPNTLCTDNGRAINQIEPGWQSTLTGVPKEVYELWERQFKDRGYKLRVEIIDYPNGMPGDVAMTLTWAES